MTTTLDTLRGILARDHALPAVRMTPDATLEDLGIDSLATIEMLWNVESEFGIEVPSEPAALRTLGEVADYVDELVAAQAGGPGDPGGPDAATGSAPSA